MIHHFPLQTLTIRKSFLIFVIFFVVMLLYSMLAKPINAQISNNCSQQSNYFQGFRTNNTDKDTMLILLANLVDEKISNVFDALEISSTYESLKNLPFLKNISSEFNGIQYCLDLDKRNLAKDILQRNKDIASIFLFYLVGISIWENHIRIKSNFHELTLRTENGIKELSITIKPMLVPYSCLL